MVLFNVDFKFHYKTQCGVDCDKTVFMMENINWKLQDLWMSSK